MAPQRGNEPFGPQKSFVTEMRAQREAAGLSRNKLAEILGCTPQWLAKVENFEKPPSEGLADDLDTFFATGGTFRRLWEQMSEARKQGLIPSGFRPLIEAEREADQICIFDPLLVNGLIQIESLARLVLSVGLRADRLDERLAIRMERQAILAKDDPPLFFLLIRESVIRDIRQEFHVEQCKRILDLMQQPGIYIQVIPKDALVFQPGGFQLLSFKRKPDVAYVDGAGSNSQMLTDPDEVRALTVLFNVIRSAALSAEESENLIRTIMEST
jgi:transcriptional regulator with XRE-family HTH domain